MMPVISLLRLSSIQSTCRTLFGISRTQNVSQSSVVLTPSKSSIAKSVDLPERPKKPLTPYFRFMRDIRPTMSAKNPNTPAIDLVRMIAQKWETVDMGTKQKLEAEYKKDQESYLKVRTQYEMKLTDEHRQLIAAAKQEKIDAKEKRIMRKRNSDLGKPKRPASAFLRFLISERAKASNTDGTYQDWHRSVTEKWLKLPESAKEVYVKDARKEFETHKVVLLKWEEQMIRLGNVDVVRNESLIDVAPPKPRRKAKVPSE